MKSLRISFTIPIYLHSVWLGAEVQNDIVHWDDGHVAPIGTYEWINPGNLKSGCLARYPTASGSEAHVATCDTLLGIVCVTTFNSSSGNAVLFFFFFFLQITNLVSSFK